MVILLPSEYLIYNLISEVFIRNSQIGKDPIHITIPFISFDNYVSSFVNLKASPFG